MGAWAGIWGCDDGGGYAAGAEQNLKVTQDNVIAALGRVRRLPLWRAKIFYKYINI